VVAVSDEDIGTSPSIVEVLGSLSKKKKEGQSELERRKRRRDDGLRRTSANLRGDVVAKLRYQSNDQSCASSPASYRSQNDEAVAEDSPAAASRLEKERRLTRRRIRLLRHLDVVLQPCPIIVRGDVGSVPPYLRLPFRHVLELLLLQFCEVVERSHLHQVLEMSVSLEAPSSTVFPLADALEAKYLRTEREAAWMRPDQKEAARREGRRGMKDSPPCSSARFASSWTLQASRWAVVNQVNEPESCQYAVCVLED